MLGQVSLIYERGGGHKAIEQNNPKIVKNKELMDVLHSVILFERNPESMFSSLRY